MECVRFFGGMLILCDCGDGDIDSFVWICVLMLGMEIIVCG